MSGESREALALEYAQRVVADPALLERFHAFMDQCEARVFTEWRAGAFEDWAMCWGELDAIKRLRYAVISTGEVQHGKATSDNARPGRRGSRAATAAAPGTSEPGSGVGIRE